MINWCNRYNNSKKNEVTLHGNTQKSLKVSLNTFFTNFKVTLKLGHFSTACRGGGFSPVSGNVGFYEPIFSSVLR